MAGAFWQNYSSWHKTMESDVNETGSVQFGSYFFLGWMCYAVNQLRRGLWEVIYELHVLFHDRSWSSQDECHRVELRWCGRPFLELVMILITFPEYECSLFRYEHRVQERRMHYTELNCVLNTVFCEWPFYCLQVAPCLHFYFLFVLGRKTH